MRPLVLAVALSLAAPAAAHSEWRPVDETTGQIRDVEGLEQLARDFPDSGSVRLRMLQPLLQAGEIDKLLETLGWLKDRGYVFGKVPQQQIPKLIGEDHAEAARALLIPEAQVLEASQTIAAAPAEAGLVESVFAPRPDVLVVTSITGNDLWVMLGESWVRMNIEGAGDLSGMVQSKDGKTGWVASGNLDDSDEPEEDFSGLLHLDGNEVAMRLPAPEGVEVSDLSLGPDATVYASDPKGGGIYMARTTDRELVPLIEPGTFRSPQGTATSADGKRLYVSDYRYGIAVVDLETRAVSRLESDLPVILDGVDGLWRYHDELIAVQNGTSPMRISAFKLSEDGSRVVGHRILEQAHPGWTEPLGGSIDKDALIYVATGQWDRYVAGTLADGKEPIATEIRRLPLQKPQ